MMNPIIDIFAAAKPADATLPGVQPAPGNPIAGGLFAQAIAEAIGAVNGPVAESGGIPALLAGSNIATDGERPKVSDQVLNTVSEQSLPDTTTLPAIEGKNTNAVVASGVVQLLVDSSALTGQPAPAVPLSTVPTEPTTRALTFARTETPLLSLPTLPEAPASANAVLQTALESVLAGVSDQKQSPATIPAQVEISDDAAAAIVSDPTISIEQKSPTADISATLPRSSFPRSMTSLKAQLRREFPAAKLESATGKVNIQVKLSDSQPLTAPQDNSAATATPIKSVELPIVTTNQMARTVNEVAGKKPTLRSNREPAASVKSSATASAKPGFADSREVRQQSVSGIRKPVLQALKAQGFDFEKLMNKSEDDGATVISVAAEKSSGTLAAEKPTLTTIDRSAELNGIERFKLDIKRGHIEALLKKGEIKLQLQPDHLGSLKIKLITSPTETSARLETSSEEARRTVEASIPALRESFERVGLKLNSVEVVIGNDSDSRRQSAFQQEANARNASTKRQALRSEEVLPLITEIDNTAIAAHYGGALNLVA